MKVGDLVWVKWTCHHETAFVGPGVIVECMNLGFFTVFCEGGERMLHSDYLGLLNAKR
jgi:hypothetical protein